MAFSGCTWPGPMGKGPATRHSLQLPPQAWLQAGALVTLSWAHGSFALLSIIGFH